MIYLTAIMDKKKTSLLVVPEPYPDETTASWIQRLCQMHQCSFHALFHAFGIRPPRDPDLQLRPASLARLAYKTSSSIHQVRRLGRVFSVARKYRCVMSELNFDLAGRPKYRFCPKCLSEDKDPYWRIAWRFKIWEICPTHHLEMQEQCPHCESFIKPYRSSIGVDIETDTYRSLLHCVECHMTLTSGTMDPLRIDEKMYKKLEVQRAFVSAAICGYYQIEGYDKHLPLEFLIFLKNRNVIHAVERRQLDSGFQNAQRVSQLIEYFLHQFRHENKFKRSQS